jgi:tryptophan-rich sensory protein
VLSVSTAASVAVVLCVIVAVLEGICAGRNVRSFFGTLRFPRYSAPLWVWSIIGIAYYATFGFVAFRLLSAVSPSFLARTTLALLGAMMVGNALANLVIFRARNLHLSHLIGCVFAGLDVLLAGCVLSLDRFAGSVLVPYLVYRIYAVWWGRTLARLNP